MLREKHQNKIELVTKVVIKVIINLAAYHFISTIILIITLLTSFFFAGAFGPEHVLAQFSNNASGSGGLFTMKVEFLGDNSILELVSLLSIILYISAETLKHFLKQNLKEWLHQHQKTIRITSFTIIYGLLLITPLIIPFQEQLSKIEYYLIAAITLPTNIAAFIMYYLLSKLKFP